MTLFERPPFIYRLVQTHGGDDMLDAIDGRLATEQARDGRVA